MADVTAGHRKTPLYSMHVQAGAKMVPFGGWLMPVSYSSVLGEHKAVRQACGIFDVSHMGEIRVTGKDAARFLQWLTINDVSRLSAGAGQYSAILNTAGGMIDDLIIYKLGDDEFFICVNASNRQKDFEWIRDKSRDFEVSVTDESDQWAQIAVQGPNSQAAISSLLQADEAQSLKNLSYTHIMKSRLGGEGTLIARTGYTGELGFEIYLPAASAPKVWAALYELAGKHGLVPVGLGARDTLRLESCYLLYGNDMNESVSPLEAGISWATKIDKGDFVGRSALIAQKSSGVKRRMVAFTMTDEGIPRHGMPIFANGRRVGEVTSGSVLPTVGGAGGMALVDSSLADGETISVEIRGHHKLAKIVRRPLYAARTK